MRPYLCPDCVVPLLLCSHGPFYQDWFGLLGLHIFFYFREDTYIRGHAPNREETNRGVMLPLNPSPLKFHHRSCLPCFLHYRNNWNHVDCFVHLVMESIPTSVHGYLCDMCEWSLRLRGCLVLVVKIFCSYIGFLTDPQRKIIGFLTDISSVIKVVVLGSW